VLLANNRFLASASNNLNRPSYLVSTKPRSDEQEEHKQYHEQLCFEEPGGLEQIVNGDSQKRDRLNTHCNVPLSATLEELSKAHTYCRFQLALIAEEVRLAFRSSTM